MVVVVGVVGVPRSHLGEVEVEEEVAGESSPQEPARHSGLENTSQRAWGVGVGVRVGVGDKGVFLREGLGLIVVHPSSGDDLFERRPVAPGLALRHEGLQARLRQGRHRACSST